ncbi:MAG TPA: hypothetical protein VFM93_12885 [Candidatus Limnocylindria bacterium]|nr:hypothetical protein [Candidatus Limnocylindria bacterium]
MRRIHTLLLVAVLAHVAAVPAAAWDPESSDWDVPADDVSWWEPEPTSWSEPEPPYTPPAVVYEVPDGLYLVTEVYAGEIVTTAGPVTTYATATYQDTPGTYARVLGTVATGAHSALDGAAFNGRASLSDGRPVAGTYYENFVLTEGGFQPVSIVFFQDDSEVAPPPVVEPVPVPVGPRPLPAPEEVPLVGRVVPILETPPTAPRALPVVTERDDREPPLPRVTVGLSPEPLGDARSRIEVLRARGIRLWPTATVDGAPARVLSWRLSSGELVLLGPASAAGDRPLYVRWDRVGPTSVAVTVTVQAGVRTIDMTAEIAVVVRAPALVQ